MDLMIPTYTPRPSPREIGTNGMMMHYSEPQIIADQVAALKSLGLIEAAMPSIEEHNPVLATAIATGNEHFLDYSAMYEKPEEYSYEGVDGGLYRSETTTWVAHLHYELQTVALFGLMDLLENGEIQQDQIADYSVALGDTSLKQNAFLAFNFNPARQPYEFFDTLKMRLRSEGFAMDSRGYDSFYSIPSFLWANLNSDQRGQLAAEILHLQHSGNWGSFDDRVLGREFGSLLGSIFAWNKELNRKALVEGETQSFLFDFGKRFAQGRIEFADEGFLWIEELRGLVSAR